MHGSVSGSETPRLSWRITYSLQLEHTGSIVVQVLAGLWLDKPKHSTNSNESESTSDVRHLLMAFLLLSVLQFLTLLALAHLHLHRGKIDQELCSPGENLQTGYVPVAQNESQEAIETSAPAMEPHLFPTQSSTTNGTLFPDSYSGSRLSEMRRGRFFACISVLFICCSWLLFFGTAWFRLHSRDEGYHQ